MTTPEGQPESSAYGPGETAMCPTRSSGSPWVPEQSPLTPVFDEATRRSAPPRSSRRTRSRGSALLPLLHLVQSVEGYAWPAFVRYCAEVLELTTAEVSAVATFYMMYKRTPCGEHLVSVCTNTPGGRGAGRRRDLRPVDDGARSGTRRWRVSRARPGRSRRACRCSSPCASSALVLQVNYEYLDNQTVETAEEYRRRPLRSGAPVTDPRRPTDGPAHRRAGAGRDLPDLAAVAGNSAAPETLRGAQLAAERCWVAPAMPDTAAALPDLPEKSR